tara:strand:+ start:219 stop:1091 length:873 start_codon:yes stop_codon:yes gene_type:complete
LILDFKYYSQLIKLRLSITVVFSAIAGYLLGVDTPNSLELFLLAMGGLLVTGSANAFNQIIERDRDRLMERTKNRPLPSNNLSINQAIIFAIIIGFIGLYFLSFLNLQCAFFALLSLLMYTLFYTPLKKISSISIFIGAFPGAIPCLLGWVGATNDFGLAAGILFAIQFCWQFPHFIAISWLLEDQYKAADLKMIIGRTNKKFSTSSLIALIFSVFMTAVSITPWLFIIKSIDLSSLFALIIFTLGLYFTFITMQLFLKGDKINAKKILISSYIYLPLVQILYILDKYLN